MPGKKTEVLFGFHSVCEALKAGKRRFETVFISENRSHKRSGKISSLAEDLGVPVKYTDAGHLDKLARSTLHQGIAANTSLFPMEKGANIKARIHSKEGDPLSSPFFILVVEQMEDPHNLGALIRTALCSGVDHIMIPKDRCAQPSPTVSRTSAGAMEHARIFSMTNTAATLRLLKENGAWVAGLDAAGDTGLYEADFTGNLVLVIGGEHKGIRPGVRKECDFLVSIPMQGPVSSLNASVAGGIAMYEALRRRRAST